MAEHQEYFFEEEHSKIAAFLGLSLQEYLKQKVEGRIPDLAKPLDPRRVVFKETLRKWHAAGRPVQLLHTKADPITGTISKEK